MQRTKVFSKLKIIHNYFEESNDDFSQLASKGLKLLSSKSLIPKKITRIIEGYFKLESPKVKPFRDTLSAVLQEKRNVVPDFTIVCDAMLQDLMLGIFSMMTGVWNQALGKIINKTLENKSLSPKLKAVLLSCFFEKF